MQFIYTDPQTDLERMLGGFHHINAFGSIEAGDDEKFKTFLEAAAPPPRTTIYIDSTGGNVEAALGIGRLIRDGWFSTTIGRYHLDGASPEIPLFNRKLLPGKCYSAATLMYLGGRLRYFSDGSEFGVHQFSYKNPTPENFARSQTLSAKIAQFIVEMGVSVGFLEISSSTPGSEISIVELELLRSMGVVTGGQTEAKWNVQARAGMIYVRGERDSLFGHHKVLLGYTRSAGFLFWAFIEAQGREEELTSFGLVEIVVNGEDTRIDISSRCERMTTGIYVSVIANLTEEEARLVAFSDSFGVQVRFSSDAGMFFGISPMSTNGGRDELETLFNCFKGGPPSEV